MISGRKFVFDTKTTLLAGSSRRDLARYLVNDQMSREDMLEYSARLASEHASFAFQHSPFYRDFYGDHGIRLEDLRDPAAFSSLPILDKAVLRDNIDRIRSSEWSARNSTVAKTGGSTGLPLHIHRDLRFPARALEWRLFDWWGVNPWDDRGIVMRHMREGRARLWHRLQWWPSRRLQLDAFKITDDSVREFVDSWNRISPPFLIGYGGGVLELARRLVRMQLDFTPPRAIAVTAAPLAAGVRDEIQQVLGAPCFDHYRSAEIPWIAGECGARDGLHVFADVRQVEIVDALDTPVAPGSEGQVVVTDMTNRVFPIIRYRLGDISSYREGDCSCGRALPRLGAISGRSSDMVILPDGATIAGALGHIFDHSPLSVRQFEIVQAADYSVTLRCIPSDNPDALEGIAIAAENLRDRLGGAIPVTVLHVDHIPQVGGKMRFIRSEVGRAASGNV